MRKKNGSARCVAVAVPSVLRLEDSARPELEALLTAWNMMRAQAFDGLVAALAASIAHATPARLAYEARVLEHARSAGIDVSSPVAWGFSLETMEFRERTPGG